MDIHRKIREELLNSTLHEAQRKRLVAVLDGIHSFINADDQAYVDQKNLAAVVGCGLTTIKKATKELEELGYLERIRTKRSTDQKYHWNAYQLIYPPRVADSESIAANHVSKSGWIYNPTWDYVKPLLTKDSVHLHERHGGMTVVSATDDQVVLLDAGLVTQKERPRKFLDGYGGPVSDDE